MPISDLNLSANIHTLKRVDDWQIMLVNEVSRLEGTAFKWGTNDCFSLMMSMVEAITGDRPYKSVKYKSYRGSIGQLKKRGFKNLEEAIAAKFVRVPFALAQRGDLVVINDSEVGKAGGVLLGTDILVMGLHGTHRYAALSSKQQNFYAVGHAIRGTE
jgi:hypothetical protein